MLLLPVLALFSLVRLVLLVELVSDTAHLLLLFWFLFLALIAVYLHHFYLEVHFLVIVAREDIIIVLLFKLGHTLGQPVFRVDSIAGRLCVATGT